MLSLSAADEAELERWRVMLGRCELPENRRRAPLSIMEALQRLPRALAIVLRDKVRAKGALGSVHLNPGDVADIEILDKIGRTDIMMHMLAFGAALAQTQTPGGALGAVAEGGSGGLYLGANIEWRGSGIKFSVHGAQAAVLNAWQGNETTLRGILVETEPCACCRQFLREIWDWANMKIMIAPEGPIPGHTIREIGLNLKGLRTENLVGHLLRRQFSESGAVESRDLAKLAGTAARDSYAPYSKNFAGVALRAKNGVIHCGRYAETRESIAGTLAIEGALVDLVLSGGQVADVEEISLVEAKGVVTQFAATQQLASRMGDVPFKFLMAK
jgi:cytidine deaminase